MAKSRKRRSKKSSKGKRPSPKMVSVLSAAMDLYEEGDPSEAIRHLRALARKYPHSKAVLSAVLEVSLELEDWRTFAYFGEQFAQKARGYERAETLNNLVYAYIQMAYPGLAMKHALELLDRYPEFDPQQKMKSFIEAVKPSLDNDAAAIFGQATTPAERDALMAKHDRVRFLTESGYGAEAIQEAKTLLAEAPDMPAVRNNLSMCYFMVGDIEAAIATAEDMLDEWPDNIHTLGNLTRFYFLTAQFDQAEMHADRLTEIDTDHPDLLLKKAETYAWLGRDENVLAIYTQFQTISDIDAMHPTLMHLAAVASYRLGKEKKAWQLWEKAAAMAPYLEMAEAALSEKRLPVGQRDVPWYWSFPYWFPQDIGELFAKYLSPEIETADEKNLTRAMHELLDKRPYLPALIPHMLERGDGATRGFVVKFAQLIDTPELAEIMYNFALSPYGTDALRLEAAQFVSQSHPDILPENKIMPMWIDGQQKELFMMSFEITDEPSPDPNLPKAILDKHEAAYHYLMDRDADRAEQLLHEIIAEAPDFPSAYNQLGVAYEMQGQTKKARALVAETHARFPDYFFSRVALARIKIAEGQIEEGKELLDVLSRQTQLHISEFQALAQAYIELALAKDNPESARHWLQMWQQVNPDNPMLDDWKRRIAGKSMLQELKGSAMQSLRKIPRRKK